MPAPTAGSNGRHARCASANRRWTRASAWTRWTAASTRSVDQRAQLQRLQQADATNRVLRDELLGIGQRAALIEDTVSKLADPDRHGAQALRLDEAELLLTADARLARCFGP